MGIQSDLRVSARATNASDALQLWTLEFDTRDAYRICMEVDGKTMALAWRNPHAWISVRPVRPALEAPSRDSAQLWRLNIDASRQIISHFDDPNYVLDISGNSGWGPGTDILCYWNNNGNNQHWSFQPQPRNPAEVHFYDIIAPAASLDPPSVVADVQRMYGAWGSISKDLELGLEAMGPKFDLGEPFISGLNADAAIASWKSVADDAAAFAQFARAVQ